MNKIVLIVEKDTGVANMIRAILGVIKVPAQHVQDGTTAAEALATTDTGLIICDSHIGGITANTLLRQVRDSAALQHIPFIMLVDGTDTTHANLPPAEAADRYITKPFTARTVLDVVKEFMVYKEL